ncbi:asparagine synthase (glutamine-hydrolyzing) [Streptomyces sp. NBC_00335]|uniref:asparagine synthase (glutamine-hydrolyzing) n=1 Tax=unclassified Streptomyces TaxID=2593676 RepID=UPI0022528A6A|nr:MULTISPECIES: asparagine synthase (glutamine-hydrolyzing) [unclassified Streptomyces]MCX5404018.1 asparagine synthase (glutamine-hydrolyzing) [Streptomyces sp. NBC_00086]
MCRIFGSFSAGAARPDPGELAAVSARQRHGGPDEHDVLSGAGWSLGCDRLAVTDLRGGRQPYRLPHLPGIIAVLNGEIYNHRILRRELAARGHRFPDTCDGTLLPALYAEYGPAFAERLDGMFAVAVLDLRASPLLVLAVDPMGMKPIHYHRGEDGSFRFASEIPALLAFEGVRITPRADTLDTVLATRTPFSTQTALEGISVMPPGATAVVSPGREPAVRRRPVQPAAPSEAGFGTEDVLRREVRRLARADVPVCALTSGGLDSGLVTALAAEYARETGAPSLHTFHLTYQGRWPGSEHIHARAVARQARTVHHEVALDPGELGSLLTRATRHLGQPNADPIALSTYALFRAVREAGFTVALTGDGADELFGGYARMREALEAPAGGDWAASYADALSAAPRMLREYLYTPAYRAYIAEEGSAADRIVRELRSARTDRLTAITSFETRWRLPAYHLRRVDHLSMAWAVEARMPFCQPAVAAHARELPSAARRGKLALYEAGRDLLPATVLNRPKQPFTLPVTAMLSPGSPLLEPVRELLSPDRLLRGGQVRPDRVQRLLARQLERPSDQDALTLWALATHELWTEVVRGMGIPVGCAA